MMTSVRDGVRPCGSGPESHQAVCAVSQRHIILYLADLTKPNGLHLAGTTWEDGRYLTESECGINMLYLTI